MIKNSTQTTLNQRRCIDTVNQSVVIAAQSPSQSSLQSHDFILGARKSTLSRMRPDHG